MKFFSLVISFALRFQKGEEGGGKIRTSDVAQRPLILWRRKFGNPMVLASRYRGPKFIAS